MLFFVLGTFALLFFLAFSTWQSALVLRQIKLRANLLLLPIENVMRLGLVLICFLLGRASDLPNTQFGWTFDGAGDAITLGVIVGVLTALTIPLITRWAIRQFGKQVYSPIVVQSIMPRQREEWLWVPIALVPAVALEELLFRSLLLGGFASFAPPLLLAIIWSIIFGAMHVPQGSLGVVVASLLGIVLSILFLVTHNLLAPMVAHYLINLIQLVWAAKDRYWENYGEGSHS